MDINGAAAIITGGGSGLGAASARLLAKRGARCVIVDRNEETGSQVAAELGGVFVAADVADEEQVQAAVDTAVGLGPLRVLVNGAGIGPPARTLDRDGAPLPLKRFDFVVRVNLLGTFNCIRLAAAAMAVTEPLDEYGSRGAIVNMASVAAFDGQIGQAAYSASKAGVVGMTLPIARDLAVVGIRVNTVAPGLIDTPIYGTGEKAEAFKARLGESVLFPHRLGTADELASVVVELVTNDYVNAETVRVDGGVRLPPK
ncbi:SDR family NAD(P)-dependent oxidoreductase [Pseudofrankia asymbiotica]|uniref:3-hydroxyacyl-CoA dehydrogenase n=1 Tax=Pseudofrankia asymbiotica TaxID=1834516 RepID=A0A1V2IF03_9ACTN|nr:SDR family NAD(P)-dependent oxidoreductase [Pseudofrankia asymbiotica]ONH31734.1 3-hydroxyacyl-CoA dehydrogenase [Pseudofrankia asymbiotica]